MIKLIKAWQMLPPDRAAQLLIPPYYAPTQPHDGQYEP
jgi:hypothetical protein